MKTEFNQNWAHVIYFAYSLIISIFSFYTQD